MSVPVFLSHPGSLLLSTSTRLREISCSRRRRCAHAVELLGSMARAQVAPRARSAAEIADPPPRRQERVSAERRRRARHYAARRRDLTIDVALGLFVAVVLLSLTAGLGVLALVLVPLAIVLVVTGVLDRRRARGGSGRRLHSRH
jgi:Flp pilus assembly protein TadB